ncbi:DUF4054 domain-containing protein [Methylobacterium tarhaniae]|uniref:DUF4054 domain-containing protein n=1 Tax=Methylobacterium tarhaniae TaxID=1187852 RepID=UPI003D0726B1
MAWTEPTAADLRARFPAFAGVADAAIALALAEALAQVDDTWPDAIRTSGALLYAAHVLTLDGQGGGVEAEIAKAGALGFTSFRSGSLSLDRGAAAGGGSGSSDPLEQTSYGRRFLELVRARFPGVLVV